MAKRSPLNTYRDVKRLLVRQFPKGSDADLEDVPGFVWLGGGMFREAYTDGTWVIKKRQSTHRRATLRRYHGKTRVLRCYPSNIRTTRTWLVTLPNGMDVIVQRKLERVYRGSSKYALFNCPRHDVSEYYNVGRTPGGALRAFDW